MVPSPRDADVLFHSPPLDARPPRRTVLVIFLHNWDTHEERQISAIRTAVKTHIPKQKPSPNLSPVKTMMFATFDFYGLIRLQQIDRPRLSGINPENEDGVLAIQLSGNRDSGKRVVGFCFVRGKTATHPHGGVGIKTVIRTPLSS